MLKDTTIVLGGGGVWGVAWMTGLLHGLAEHGADLSRASAFIGTSAGSIVAAQLASGNALPVLYRRQCSERMQHSAGAAPATDVEKLGALLRQTNKDHVERAKELGALALRAQTIPYGRRREVLIEHLGLGIVEAWPATRLVVTAVDCNTAELTTFDATSGVSLIDAIAASCAVPGVYPATPIGGRFFMDGGVWKTSENAHLARGAARAVIVAPVGAFSPAAALLHADIAELRSAGSQVVLVTPDEPSVAAASFGMLDPASRKPAAEAGRAQAATAISTLRSVMD